MIGTSNNISEYNWETLEWHVLYILTPYDVVKLLSNDKEQWPWQDQHCQEYCNPHSIQGIKHRVHPEPAFVFDE